MVHLSTREEITGCGAQLWVLSKNNNKRERLNWLLNFQVTGADHHRSQELPSKVQEILNKCELRNLDFIEEQSQNLLIASRDFLPSDWVLLIEKNDNAAWASECFRSWVELGKPKLRIFLPPDFSPAEFERVWSHLDPQGGPAVEVAEDVWT